MISTMRKTSELGEDSVGGVSEPEFLTSKSHIKQGAGADL